jgi:hypothetical protein
MKQLWENESCHVGRNEMAGLKGKSGPPGNMLFRVATDYTGCESASRWGVQIEDDRMRSAMSLL